MFSHAQLIAEAEGLFTQWMSAIGPILQGRLPMQLVGPTQLTAILERIQSALASEDTEGLILTHPNVAYYYNAHCVLASASEKALYIQIQVPFQARSTMFHVYHVLRYPVFLPNNQTATTITSVPEYYGISEDLKSEVLLSSNDFGSCSGTPMKCAAPLLIQALDDKSCLGNLFLRKSTTSCSYAVSLHYNVTSVKRVDKYLLISNPVNRIRMHCLSDPNVVKSVCASCLLKLPCGCTLMSSGKTWSHMTSVCDRSQQGIDMFSDINQPFAEKVLDLKPLDWESLSSVMRGNLTDSVLGKLPRVPDPEDLTTDDHEFSRDMEGVLQNIKNENRWSINRSSGSLVDLIKDNVVDVIQIIIIVILCLVAVIFGVKYFRQHKLMLRLSRFVLRRPKSEGNTFV
ncbi:unnamed protein product [Owenia fusiformis]|uniref:Uncharacterized protein n=1 Tax=Owenia fusiformis TaxID=6347 RepID=A0A8S4QBI8_OWEFU|nr:unnamed protein product [Owenia fusiformis]